MGIFSFGEKKKEDTPCFTCEQIKSPCACGEKCGIADTQNARIIVLACCKKSAETFENVKKAVSELGLAETVLNIGDAIEIAKYGVMQTPALVVDGKVVSYGSAISVQAAKVFIEKAGEKSEQT